jgi:hypothetical protein
MKEVHPVPLTLRATEGLGPDQFSVFDDGRYIGRVYETTDGDWIWGLNFLAAGDNAVSGRSGTRAIAVAELKIAAGNLAQSSDEEVQREPE